MIACIAIPYFAAAVERRDHSVLAEKPLAIGGQPWEARPVYAFSQEAAQQGVRIGMSLRVVQVLSPHSHFLPAAETRYSKVSGEVIDQLLDFSPMIEPQEWWHPFKEKKPLTIPAQALPARYCLDLERLPQREALPFVQEIGRTLRKETYFSAAIGLAANKFTAEVAATVCRSNHTLPVKEGHDAHFLASRSLKFLPIERDIARRLRLLGIYTMGQLANLPLPALQEQFGPPIVSYYRLARGEAVEQLDARLPERTEKVEMRFDGPVNNMHVLKAAAAGLAAELAYRLREAGLLGRQIMLLLDREDGQTWQQRLTLGRPTSRSIRLATAVNEMLDKEPFDCAICRVEITLADISPAQGIQLTLFDSTGRVMCRPQGGARAVESLRNLIIKYRQSNFFQPVLADAAHPLPERRFLLQPLSHDALVA